MNDDLSGLVPEWLQPRTYKILLEDYTLDVDIGFHAFEVGTAQRLSVTVEVLLDGSFFPKTDEAADAWDYDSLRNGIAAVAVSRRWNLQETFAREIYAVVASRQGVTGLRVRTSKPDVYPDCRGVGVELASF